MEKYVWAFISYFDNNLVMGHLYADNECEALIKALSLNGLDYEEGPIDSNEIKQFAFDCDSMVGVYRVS